MFAHACSCPTVILIFVHYGCMGIHSGLCGWVCECECRMEPVGVQSQHNVGLYQYLTAEPANGWIFNMTLEHNKDMKTWGTWERMKERDGEWQKGSEWDKVEMWAVKKWGWKKAKVRSFQFTLLHTLERFVKKGS